jgi:hypothetical protein
MTGKGQISNFYTSMQDLLSTVSMGKFAGKEFNSRDHRLNQHRNGTQPDRETPVM